jgi:lipopolysaccharide export system permease protein
LKLRPKLLDYLVLREIVPLFFVMFVVFAGIIIVVSSAGLVKFITQGVPLWIVVQLIGYNILPLLVATFPMAMLLASIVSFVRLSTQSETVALFAAGIPFKRLVVPVAVFSALISLLAFYTNNAVSPYAAKEFDRLHANLSHELDETTKPFDLPAERDDNGKLTLLVHVEGGYDVTTRSLRNIYLFETDPKNGDVTIAIHAAGAQWAGGENWTLLQPVFILKRGMYSSVGGNATVTDLRVLPDTVTFVQNGPQEFDFQQLYKQIAEAKAAGEDDLTTRQAEVWLWDIISVPLACFVFALVGMPLGLRPQRSSAAAVAVSLGLGIIFAYYALYEYMQVLGESGHMSPVVAAFLPDGIALAIGLVLLKRSSS